MTPAPEDARQGSPSSSAGSKNPPPTLRKRAEFLAVRGGGRSSGRTFLLEWRKRDGDQSEGPARFGFTVTKKTGKAVVRNRIRRRLREAVRLHAPGSAEAGCDYVLVGRPAALDAAFGEIVAELAKGLDRARRFNANPRQSGPKRNDGRQPEDRTDRRENSAGTQQDAATKRR